MSTSPNLSLQLPGATVYDARLGDISSLKIALGQLDTIVAQVQADVAAKASKGDTGAQGPAGPQGLMGPAGAQGPAGNAGVAGAQGPTGPTGPTGATGPQGIQGFDGAAGPQGIQGVAGNNGAAGANGNAGPVGPQGPVGPTGPQGVAGTNGIIGVDGATGATGPTGPQGPTGATGTFSGTSTDNLSEGSTNLYHTVARVNALIAANTTLNANSTIGGLAVGTKILPQNSKSVAYTCVDTDSAGHILHPTADTTARIYTIPSNASVPYPVGTVLTFVNQHGAGSLQIAINVDAMYMAGTGTTGTRTLAANGQASALKVTATEWQITGVNLT